jgi:SAM-dependent methyltransferase
VIGFGNTPAELPFVKELFGLKKVHGIDFVDKRVASARSFLEAKGYDNHDFPLYTADMRDMRDFIVDDSVDLVSAVNVTMQDDDNIDGFADEIVRILRPGGVALILTVFDRFFVDHLKQKGKVLLESNGRLVFVKNEEPGGDDAGPGGTGPSTSLQSDEQGEQDVGGVDFSAENMNVEIQNSRVKSQSENQQLNESNERFNPQTLYPSIPLDLDSIQGLTPVIINIAPITNFYQVMGLTKEHIDQVSLTR